MNKLEQKVLDILRQESLPHERLVELILEVAEKAYNKGAQKGHWEGRLAILSLPGCNYAGGAYQEGAEHNLKNTGEFEDFKKEII